MGVPDEIEGLVRKRPRLSLRTSNKADQSKLAQETASVGIVHENTKDVNRSNSTLVKTLDIDAMADLPLSPAPVAAPVASLHNLGNTCFLNSVLEVLRYTPGFLDGLIGLHEEILAQEVKVGQETSDDSSCEVRSNWQVVKNTCLMYSEMAKKESQHTKIATADVSSMAVRPSVLLDNIRELNPMFEGHFQHDAQELLRCLLCYIEDAEKELRRLKEREQAIIETNQAIADIEAKFTGNTKVGQAERGTSSNDWVSLKGGDNRGSSKKILQGRQISQSTSLNTPQMKNTTDKEESSENSLSTLCDKTKPDNQISTFHDVDVYMKASNGDYSPCTGNRNVKEELETLSQRRVSKARKRPRPSPVSSNSPTDSYQSTHPHRLRKRLFHDGTSSNSVITGRSENNDTKISHYETPSVSGIDIPVDNTQISAGSCHEVNFSQNTFPSSPHCNTSSKIMTQTLITASMADSSKPCAQSLPAISKTKRLGMRGRALCDSVTRASHGAEAIDDTQVRGDNDDFNDGDVNNNSDSFLNNNDNSFINSNSFIDNNIDSFINNNNSFIKNNNDSITTTCSSRFSSLNNEEKQRTNLSTTLKHITQCTVFHEDVITLSDNSNSEPAAVSSLSRTEVMSPTRSTFVVEHPLISENGVPVVNSPADPATKKYYSLSQSADCVKKNPPSLPSPSHTIYAGLDSFTEPSSDALNTLRSYPNVHVPNKAITVNVLLSPKKQSSSPHLPSHFVSPDNKHLCDKPLLSPGDTCLSGLHHKTEVDSDSSSSFSLPAKLFKDRQYHSQEEAGSKTATSLGDTNHRNPSSTIFCSSTQAKRNPLDEQVSSSRLASGIFTRETVDSKRSPGANTLRSAHSIQPKLEVKKCDWLGVSPVRPISARKAMLALGRRRASENTSSARRKIPCGDSLLNSFSSHMEDACQDQPGHSHHLSPQQDLNQDLYCLLSEANNKRERRHIIEALARPANEPKLANFQTSILNFTRKSQRSQNTKKPFENPPGTPKKMMTKCSSSSTENLNCLQPVSVSVENCDWLLKAADGKPLSAKKAIMDMKNGSRLHLKSKRNISETVNTKQQSAIESTDLPVTEMKLQDNASTLIERLFGGTMMHQTKCLECEVARQRQEVFMDISVPVRSLHTQGKNRDEVSDDDSCDDSEKDKSGNLCLSRLIQTFSNVERLIGANKYFCEQCVHHVEAERSCHYLALPAVLTLHLKRFSANSRSFGGVSKLVDKVTIPLNLPCLRYRCIKHCTDSSHKYSLFAIITHSGTSILHGHYRAYVKVQHEVNRAIFHNLIRSKSKGHDTQHSTAKVNTGSHTEDFTECHFCRDAKADCEMRNASSVGINSGSGDHIECEQKVDVSEDGLNSDSASQENSVRDVGSGLPISSADFDKKSCTGFPAGTDKPKSEVDYMGDGVGSYWLECDDECIKVMDEEEFGEKLEERDGCLIGTPYVLFYHKLLE